MSEGVLVNSARGLGRRLVVGGGLLSIPIGRSEFAMLCDVRMRRQTLDGRKCRCCLGMRRRGRRVKKVFAPRPSRVRKGVDYVDRPGQEAVNCMNICGGVSRGEVCVRPGRVGHPPLCGNYRRMSSDRVSRRNCDACLAECLTNCHPINANARVSR